MDQARRCAAGVRPGQGQLQEGRIDALHGDVLVLLEFIDYQGRGLGSVVAGPDADNTTMRIPFSSELISFSMACVAMVQDLGQPSSSLAMADR